LSHAVILTFNRWEGYIQFKNNHQDIPAMLYVMRDYSLTSMVWIVKAFRASAKNNCTTLLGLWPICCVALKATYLDMQPSMRLADEPNPGAIWHNYFLPRPLSGTGLDE
jgi:hypothetical protein